MPGVKEEQLLRLWPEVLREICSDAGASAAAACLGRLAWVQVAPAAGSYSALGKREHLLLIQHCVLNSSAVHKLVHPQRSCRQCCTAQGC